MTQTITMTIIDPKEFGLEEKEGATIEQSFMPKVVEREALKLMYEQIITKELTSELSIEAGVLRKKLVKVRTGISEIHKTQKAYFLAGGRFADAIKNKETLPIEQMEEKLFDIEKFAEMQEKKLVAELQYQRETILLGYNVENASHLMLGLMTDQIWTNFLSGTKAGFEAKIAAEAKAKADAELAAKIEADRLEAQRLENIRLKEEADQRSKEHEIAIKKAAELKAIADAEAEKAKKESDKKLKAERDARAKAEAELKAIADAEAEKAADKLKAEKIAKAAPDKIKLNQFADSLATIVAPGLKTDEAKGIMKQALGLLAKVQTYLRDKSASI